MGDNLYIPDSLHHDAKIYNNIDNCTNTYTCDID